MERTSASVGAPEIGNNTKLNTPYFIQSVSQYLRRNDKGLYIISIYININDHLKTSTKHHVQSCGEF